MFEKLRSTRRDFVKSIGAVAAATTLLGQSSLSAYAASATKMGSGQKW
ncbi:hypothetical protein KDAU_51740 [Dictyobacter aurantiacus]|uniref:Uncharacterized protein n=1 Tax=Dictyobacter aurantiacus TaxID=1936993 RepID=A0A401ZLW2_9CHLR|nr:hypothetical protein KDAU_51740 [Dictyobacter aurantiacus]